MAHDYYSYDKKRLLDAPLMPLKCYEDDYSVFSALAREMADGVKQNNKAHRKTVYICPVGPVGQYPIFVDIINKEGVSLKNVWFINMDEYLTDEGGYIDKAHPLSFRGFMERAVYSRLDPKLVMPDNQRVFPDPQNPAGVSSLIDELGGVDACFGGIGINGHVAFNEPDPSLAPGEFLSLSARTLDISPETRAANAIGDFNGALEDMPRRCVTIGMKEIFMAKKIRLGCFRSWHRAVVRRAAYGEATSAFPVSLLRSHPDISLSFTDYVARLGS